MEHLGHHALQEQGISARVIDMHTIKPLDTDAVVGSARGTGALLTVEEHSIVGGLGSAVAEVLAMVLKRKRARRLEESSTEGARR